jgi:tetratricopeptide (TPR) repeat protein
VRQSSTRCSTELNVSSKSQLAMQYTYDVLRAAPSRYVFWIAAGTGARFKQAYQDLADRLFLPGRDDPKVDILKLVSDWLCDEKNGSWTMVLDGVDHPATFFSTEANTGASNPFSQSSLHTYVPQSPNGNILITSRSKDVAHRLVGAYSLIHEVPPMLEREGLRLLHNKMGDEADGTSIFELLEALGHVPLAINQAAACISRRAHMTAADYLSQLRTSKEKREGLLNLEAMDLRRDGSASNSIVAICQMSFERVRQEQPSAAELLSLMCFFNPQGIPESILQRYFESTSDVGRSSATIAGFEADLDLLQAYSLISTSPGTDLCEMNALVQSCARLWLSSLGNAKRWEEEFVQLMAREFPSATYANQHQCQPLITHIEALYDEEPADDATALAWAQLLSNVAWYMQMQGACKIAHGKAWKALQVRERILGRDHDLTLGSKCTLAIILHDQGKFEEAASLHQQVLDKRANSLGKHHRDTLLSLNCLAAVLQAQARHEEADNLHQLELESIKGGAHNQPGRGTRSLILLAKKLRVQMQRKRAETLYRQVVEGRKANLGERDLSTLTSMSNLTSVLLDLEKYDEAESLSRQVMRRRREEAGENHPDTLTSVSVLARILKEQGKFEESEMLSRQALEGRRTHLGEKHPDTLASANNLAHLFAELKRYDEATEVFKNALEGLEEVLGVRHPWTVACRDSFLVMQSEAEQAERHLRKSRIARRLTGRSR